MKRILLVCCLTGLLPSVLHAEEITAPTLTYGEVIRKALDRSPFLREAREKIGARQSRLDEASHARFLPKFEAKYLATAVPDVDQGNLIAPAGLESIQDELNALAVNQDVDQVDDFNLGPSHTIEITATQPLFTFGRLRSLRDMAEGGVRAAEQDLELRKREVVRRVTEIYFSLVLAEQAALIIKETGDELKKIRDRVDRLALRGEISQEDIQRLKLFEIALENRRAEATLGIELARGALRIAVGEPVGIDPRFPDMEPEVPPLEQLVQEAMRIRPDLKQARFGVDIRAAQVVETRSDYFPQFFVTGRFSLAQAPGRYDISNPYLSDSANSRRLGAAVGLSQSLNLLLTRDRVGRAVREKAQAEAGWLGLKDLVEIEATRAYYKYEEARLKKENNARAVRIARGWLTTASNNYSLGLISVKDVLDSFEAYLEAKKDYVETLHLYYTSLAGLEYATHVPFLASH